jgi:hypothetical protein
VNSSNFHRLIFYITTTTKGTNKLRKKEVKPLFNLLILSGNRKGRKDLLMGKNVYE